MLHDCCYFRAIVLRRNVPTYLYFFRTLYSWFVFPIFFNVKQCMVRECVYLFVVNVKQMWRFVRFFLPNNWKIYGPWMKTIISKRSFIHLSISLPFFLVMVWIIPHFSLDNHLNFASCLKWFDFDFNWISILSMDFHFAILSESSILSRLTFCLSTFCY